MWYKGKKIECEKYNAVVSYGEAYEGIPNKNAAFGQSHRKNKGVTDSWSTVKEIEGEYYIKKHSNYEDDSLTEVEELPETFAP